MERTCWQCVRCGEQRPYRDVDYKADYAGVAIPALICPLCGAEMEPWDREEEA